MSLDKICHWINLVQFKIGSFLFPVLEPLFRGFENSNPKVKTHFKQALKSLEKNKMAVALLNLNMVLSMCPKHFLARVYRGRIYIREGRFHQASEDYIRANQINQFRFIHYDLYREYLTSVNRGMGTMGPSIAQNFNQAFEVLREMPDQREVVEGQGFSDEPIPMESGPEEDETVLDEFPPGIEPEEFQEKENFKDYGPITEKEIRETDWEKLIKKLIS